MGGGQEVVETQAMCTGHERRACIDSKSACACDIQAGRVFAVAESLGPDLIDRAGHQCTLSQRQCKVTQLALDKAEPFQGLIGFAEVVGCDSIQLGANFLGKNAASIVRLEQTSNLAPVREFRGLVAG